MDLCSHISHPYVALIGLRLPSIKYFTISSPPLSRRLYLVNCRRAVTRRMMSRLGASDLTLRTFYVMYDLYLGRNQCTALFYASTLDFLQLAAADKKQCTFLREYTGFVNTPLFTKPVYLNLKPFKVH